MNLMKPTLPIQRVIKSFNTIEDPVLWNIDDLTHDYVCKHGFEDLNKLNFEALKQLIGE